MNWVDLVVVALAVLAAVSGARQGVITALPAFIGVLIGAIAGIKLAPLVVASIESTPTRVAFAVAVFVLLVALVADDAESRDRLEGVVGRHLVRFGAKDELVCSWVRTDGTQGSEQRNDADETPAETPADRPQSEES